MLEKNLIHEVNGKQFFEGSEKSIYRFQFDRTDIAANMVIFLSRFKCKDSRLDK
jgi:hypothetical protein